MYNRHMGRYAKASRRGYQQKSYQVKLKEKPIETHQIFQIDFKMPSSYYKFKITPYRDIEKVTIALEHAIQNDLPDMFYNTILKHGVPFNMFRGNYYYLKLSLKKNIILLKYIIAIHIFMSNRKMSGNYYLDSNGNICPYESAISNPVNIMPKKFVEELQNALIYAICECDEPILKVVGKALYGYSIHTDLTNGYYYYYEYTTWCPHISSFFDYSIDEIIAQHKTILSSPMLSKKSIRWFLKKSIIINGNIHLISLLLCNDCIVEPYFTPIQYIKYNTIEVDIAIYYEPDENLMNIIKLAATDNKIYKQMIIFVKSSHYNIVRALLRCGVNPNIPIDNGMSLLQIAAHSKHYYSTRIMKMLLEHGAIPFTPDGHKYDHLIKDNYSKKLIVQAIDKYYKQKRYHGLFDVL